MPFSWQRAMTFFRFSRFSFSSLSDQPLLQVTQIQLNSACLSKPSIRSKSRS